MGLIDANKLIECKFKNPISYAAFCNLVKRQPTVDAITVVHGEWVDDGDPLTLVCGVCGYRVMRYNNTKFCPDCGVRLDGKEGDHHED